MLIMVIERFRDGHPDAVGERFAARGRLIPEGLSVEYLTSWMSCDGSCCYQLMEAPSPEALDPWLTNWRDLVDFEVIPVLESSEFWRRRSTT